MNWELGATIGGLSAVIVAWYGYVKPYFNSRKLADIKRNEWQEEVSKNLATVVDTVKDHSKKIEHHETLLRDKDNACVLTHSKLENRFNGIESRVTDYTGLLKEVVSSMRNIEDKQIVMANDVGHIKDSLIDRIANVSERVDRIEDKVLG